MKRLLTSCLLLMMHVAIVAQSVGINNNALPPDPSAMLDISSNSKGLLIPRLRTTERLGITNPAIGLMVFDTDTWSFWYFAAGSVWNEITNNSDGPKGNAGGDLGGTYPNPYVKGLALKPFANLNPGHLQIIKWNNDADEWQFRNDSLVLPYNVSDTSAGSLLSITNTKTDNTSNVIVGRQQTGSGFTIQNSGIWGDNNSGFGIAGTSSNYHGVYGQSQIAAAAGVIGSNYGGGIGVWGDVNAGGYAVYGTNTSASSSSRAGLFKNTHPAGTGIVLEATTTGLGRVSEFINLNASNVQPAVVIQQAGTGSGLTSDINNNGITEPAITANNGGTGTGIRGSSAHGYGIHGISHNNSSGFFETYNTSNPYPTLYVLNNAAGSGIRVQGVSAVNSAPLTYLENQGMGTSLSVSSLNASSTATVQSLANVGLGSSLFINNNNIGSSAIAAHIQNNGSGTTLEISSLKQGTAARFLNVDITNTVPVIFAEHKGSGRGIDLRMTKTTNNSSGAYIQHDGIGTGLFVTQTGTGKGAEINMGNATNTQPGLFINSAAILGADISVTGSANPVGLKSTIGNNVSVNNGIAVLGIAGQNDNNGIGVKGIADGAGISNAIGVLGEGAISSQAIGVKGTSYNSGENEGAVTGINLSSSSGVGVYGEARGNSGAGIMGVSGRSNQPSNAARFKNISSNNAEPVVEIETLNTGNAIHITQTSYPGSRPAIQITNFGQAPFIRFIDNTANEKLFIDKTGNIITDGSLTVDVNKGIVRSSNSSQLRTEIIPAVLVVPFGGLTINDHDIYEFNVTFQEPFLQEPAVSFGGLSSSVTSVAPRSLIGTVYNITTTGCTVRLTNPRNFSVSLSAGSITWRLVATGVD